MNVWNIAYILEPVKMCLNSLHIKANGHICECGLNNLYNPEKISFPHILWSSLVLYMCVCVCARAYIKPLDCDLWMIKCKSPSTIWNIIYISWKFHEFICLKQTHRLSHKMYVLYQVKLFIEGNLSQECVCQVLVGLHIVFLLPEFPKSEMVKVTW